jgi:uncharacterized protein (PEP-CTERM system associated)
MAKPVRAPFTGSSSLPLAAPFAMLALLLSPACRAEWKVVPSVDMRATYSDNVRQESSDAARGQFIADVGPSISVLNNSPRLTLRGTFNAHLYRYFGEDIAGLNNSQRQLSADARARLIDELLFLDATGTIGQQSISAFGPQVNNSNGYSNANRTEVSTWRISPYLRHRFGATATAELRYARDAVKPGSFGLGKSVSDTASLSLASGPLFHTVGWGLQLSDQKIDDSAGGDSTVQTALANLRYRINSSLDLTMTGGYDKYDYQALGGATAGKNYSLGFNWAPSTRTSIQANAGKRYFGNSYFLSASHRSRRTVWSINYNDAVTTTRAQFLIPATIDTASMLDRLFSANIPDPIARQQAVDAYIRAAGLPASLANNINYFSNRFLLQKQLQLSAAFNAPRTTTVVALNATRRNALSTAQSDSALLGSSLSTLNDDTKQMSASLLSNYRINSLTAVNLSLTAARTESLSTGIRDNQKLATLAMTRQFERRLKGAVELRRSQGNADVTGGRNYRENAVSASLSLQL